MKRLILCALVLIAGSCTPKPNPKSKSTGSAIEQVKRDVSRVKKDAVKRKRDFEAVLQQK